MFKKRNILNKVISGFLSFFLVLQPLTPVITLAQEATPSAEQTEPSEEITVTPSPTTTPEPTPTEEPTPSPSVTPEPTPEVDENLQTDASTSASVLDTGSNEDELSTPVITEIWKTNEDGSVTTISPVVPNQIYAAPQNNKVTVTFTKLPENSGTLTIKQIILSQEDKEDLGAVTDTAYDITSTMENGTFEYTLTLPAPKTEGVEVKASEDGQNFVTLGGVSAQTDTVTITGLNHFTIFVVAGTIKDNTATTFDESNSSVLINEFVYDTSVTNDAGEWVELYNRGSSNVNLSGWTLVDAAGEELALSGTILAGGFLIFENNAWLNNTGTEKIELKNGTTLVDQVSYKNTGNTVVGADDVGTVDEGESVGRTSDGVISGDIWTKYEDPTKGYNNNADQSGVNRVTVGENYEYESIQDAIDDLNEGGTVYVTEGEYEESLEIEQSMTLLGDPGNNNAGPGDNAPTLVGDCGGDPVINIDADNVTVSGFIIIEDGCDASNIYIEGGTSGAIISDNDINEADYYGVELGSGSSDNQILRNLIHDNGDFGIYNYGATNTTIANNDIYYNNGGIGMGGGGNDVSGAEIADNNIHENYNTGIYVGGVSFSDLTISNNDIDSSEDGYGIYFDYVTGAQLTISGNTITNNYYDGIYIDQVEQESTVGITDNTITNNVQDDGSAGVYVNNVYDSTLTIEDNDEISNNSGRGLYICAEGECQNSTVTISGNTIENNSSQGIQLYWLNGSNLTVEDNQIMSNGDTGFELDYIGFGGDEGGDSNPSTASILGNTIGGPDNGNGNYGIYIDETDSNSTITIGSTDNGNTIANNNNAGIYLNSNVTGVSIIGNTIQNNGSSEDIPFTGIHVENPEGNSAHLNSITGNGVGVQNNGDGEFNAIENWWGSALGPEGDGADSVEGDVLFEPWCSDSDCEHVFFEPPEDSLLTDVLYGLPPGATLSNTQSLTYLEEKIYTISHAGGSSTVTIPTGVVITRSDGVAFNVSQLISQDVTISSLAGLGTGVVADGALQWGLPNIELSFDDPITLNIFVGTSLNGQTLNVVRSTSGSSGWTSTGIVAPGTCVVTNGLCTFQATLASYFATNRTVSSSTTTGGDQALSEASGNVAAPTCTDTKPGSAPTLLSAAAGTNSVILSWSKAATPVTYYLATYGLGPGLQQYGNPNVGGADTTTYTVSGLSGGTTYYFRVRAGNGCAPGPFSNELSTTPGGGFIAGPAAGFAPGVLGVTTEDDEVGDVGIGEEEVMGESTPSTEEALPASEKEAETGSFLARNWWWILILLILLGGTTWYLTRKKPTSPQ